MATDELTQHEADRLLGLPKRSVDTSPYMFPLPGGKDSVPLVSEDGREAFTLDLTRGSIKLTKVTYQTRCRQTIGLVRLDVDGPPHRNPDGEEIDCPHLHVFREGYGLKWAYRIEREDFANFDDMQVTLDDFMRYCHVVEKPMFNWGLV